MSPRQHDRQTSVALTADERQELTAAAAEEQRVQPWKRYRAILLLDQGRTPAEAAAAVGCCVASVYNWVEAWQRSGLVGLRERPRGGRTRLLDQRAEQILDDLLISSPQEAGYRSTEWTVPLLQRELARAGYAISKRTIRRTMHRLGWRWEQRRYVRAGTPSDRST